MADLTFLTSGVYTPGTYQGIVSVPQDTVTAIAGLSRNLWSNNLIVVTLTLDLSLDGGATWNTPHPDVDPFPVAFTTVGGGSALSSKLSTILPQPANPNRQIRGTVTVANGSINTAGILTVL